MKHNELSDFLFEIFLKSFNKWMKKNKNKESPIDVSQQLNLLGRKISEIACAIEEEYKKGI